MKKKPTLTKYLTEPVATYYGLVRKRAGSTQDCLQNVGEGLAYGNAENVSEPSKQREWRGASVGVKPSLNSRLTEICVSKSKQQNVTKTKAEGMGSLIVALFAFCVAYTIVFIEFFVIIHFYSSNLWLFVRVVEHGENLLQQSGRIVETPFAI